MERDHVGPDVWYSESGLYRVAGEFPECPVQVANEPLGFLPVRVSVLTVPLCELERMDSFRHAGRGDRCHPVVSSRAGSTYLAEAYTGWPAT